jgi:glucan phosphorylase
MKKPLTGAELNELVAGLKKLSRNLWWCWDQEAQDLFYELSPRGWQNLFHNPVAVLREVSEYELRVRLQDATFADAKRARCCSDFHAYLNDKNTWCHHARAAVAQKSGRVFFRRVRFP